MSRHILVSCFSWPHEMRWETFPLYLSFGSLCTIGIISSLNVWRNLPVKPSGSGVFFIGRFLITVSISLTGVIQIVSISSVSLSYGFQRIYLFTDVIKFTTIKLFTISPAYPFNVCRICAEVSIFMSDGDHVTKQDPMKPSQKRAHPCPPPAFCL